MGRIALSAVARQRIKKAQKINACKSSVKTWSNKTLNKKSNMAPSHSLESRENTRSQAVVEEGVTSPLQE